MPRGRKVLTEEEKEQRRKEREAKQAAQENEISEFASSTLTELIGYESAVAFYQKVESLENADKKQILSMLVDGFLDGSIEFEERVVLSLKRN